MKKLYIRKQVEKTVDEEELVIITTHESSVDKATYVIFLEK